MRTVKPDELKRGFVVLLDGVPFMVEELQVSGTAKTKHKLHATLRNLRNGRTLERVFQDPERIPLAELEHRRVQFSYREGNQFVFLDTETFEEFRLTDEQLGPRQDFLKENEEYKAWFLEGQLLDVLLTEYVTFRVTETAPPQPATQQATYKPAKLENGLEIMVPLFIGPGDMIRIDTVTRKYAGKESE